MPMQTEPQIGLTTNTLLKEELPVMTTQTQQSKFNQNTTTEAARDAQLMRGVADGISNRQRAIRSKLNFINYSKNVSGLYSQKIVCRYVKKYSKIRQ